MNRHLFVMLLIAAALAAGLFYFFLVTDFIPNPASTERVMIDSFTKVLFAIAGVFFAVIVTIFTYSLIFFRRRRGETGDGAPLRGNPPLEITWTVIPLIIVIALGSYGSIVLNRMTEVGPESTLEVDVLAFRFGWQFTYPEYGIRSFELGLPVNREVVFHIESKDVVHSFWIPEFGPKQDAVPGLTTELRLTPTKAGQYTVRCSQLCGDSHTFMTAPVRVTSPGDFQKWVQQQQASK